MKVDLQLTNETSRNVKYNPVFYISDDLFCAKWVFVCLCACVCVCVCVCVSADVTCLVCEGTANWSHEVCIHM